MNIESTSIISVSRCKYDRLTKVEPHFHGFYHIVYLMGGNSSLQVNDMWGKSIEDTVCVFKPGVCHEWTSDPKDPMRSIEVKFVTTDSSLVSKLDLLPLQFKNKNVKVRTLFENLIKEATYKRPLYKEIIRANIYELVFQMVRGQSMEYIQKSEAEEDYKIGDTDHADELNNRIIQYINKNYDKKISLCHLANILAIDLSYLCKIFKRKYGITPIQHINNLRLKKAKELLIYTEMSITEISGKVGFQSIHYFSRYFKAEKMSPLEYRHRIKEHIYIKIDDEYKDECHLV